MRAEYTGVLTLIADNIFIIAIIIAIILQKNYYINYIIIIIIESGNILFKNYDNFK